MKLWERVLLFVILAELLVVVVDAANRLARPQPPLPDLTYLDATTAEHIHQLAQNAESDTAEDWLALAKIYTVYGFFPAADLSCLRAAELESESFEISFWWGMVLDRLGRTREAIERFKEAAELAEGEFESGEDRSDVCWHHIGRNYLREENVEQAEAAFRRVDALPHSRFELAKLLVRRERSAEALSLLDELVVEQPAVSNFHQLHARAREEAGDRSGAMLSWDRVEPADHEFRVDLVSKMLDDESQDFGIYRACFEAKELARKGDNDEAAKAMREILDTTWQPSIASHLALLEMRRGLVSRTETLLEQLYEREGPIPVDLDMISIGVIYQEMGEDAKAVDMWKRTLQVSPNLAAHTRLAHYYKDAGDQQQMKQHLVMAQHMQAVEAFKDNRLEFALEAFQKTLLLDAGRPKTWFYVGECFRLLGKPSESGQAYERCLRLDPDCGQALAGIERLSEPP